MLPVSGWWGVYRTLKCYQLVVGVFIARLWSRTTFRPRTGLTAHAERRKFTYFSMDGAWRFESHLTRRNHDRLLLPPSVSSVNEGRKNELARNKALKSAAVVSTPERETVSLYYWHCYSGGHDPGLSGNCTQKSVRQSWELRKLPKRAYCLQ